MTAVAPSGVGRSEAALVALILGLAAAGWTLTYQRMGSMDAGPGTELGGLGWFCVT